MELIQSKSCLFQVNLNGAYVTILCAKSFTPEFIAKTKETTTEGDGTYQDFDYDVKSYAIALESVLVIQDGVNPTTFDLLDYHRNMVEVDFRLLYFGANGNVKAIKGLAIVESCNLSAAPDLLAEGSVKLVGKGAYEVFDFVPDFVNLRILITGNNSITAAIKFRLIDSTGQVVFQTDILPQANAGELPNPLDITVPVRKGTWAYYFQMDSNAIGNTFALNAPPTKTTNFNNGLFSESSFTIQDYDFTADRQVTFTMGVISPPPSCVAPTIPGSQTLPNAQQFINYAASIALNGTAPFNITNVTKPAWMNMGLVEVSGSWFVNFSGFPNPTGTGIPVSFDVNNACGAVNFSDTIEVTAAASPVTINWDFSEVSGSSCGFRLWVNGSLIVTTDTPNSGSISVNSFDNVEAFIVGSTFAIKHLKVRDTTTSTDLYDTTSGGSFLSYAWAAIGLHAYSVTAEGLS